MVFPRQCVYLMRLTSKMVFPFATALAIASLGASAAAQTPAPTSENTPQVRPPLQLGTRLHSQYLASKADPEHQFRIRRARLAIDFAPEPWLRGQVDIDVSAAPGLKDAFATAAVAPWLAITAGQFKKEFSRIELLSPGRLPLWRRGIVNERFVNDLGFGGRDRGLMLEGKLDGLGYALGVFNGNRSLAELDSGKDANLRLTYRLSRALRLGLSSAMKYRNSEGVDWPRKDIWAAGIDGRLRLDPLEVVGEGLWGIDGTSKNGRHQAGALVYLLLRLPRTDSLQARPVVRFEILDDNLRRQRDLAWSLTGGVNLHIGDSLRVMIQVEEQRNQASSTLNRQRLVVVQLAFDEKFSISTIPK